MANVSESFSRWRRYVDPYARDAPEISTNLLGKAASVALGIYLLWRIVRWFLLPKPIPGIPYIETSAQNIMSDIPAMTEHLKATDGTFVTYLRSVMERLNSPVVQIFMFPLGKPICSATLPRRKTCSFGRGLVRDLMTPSFLHNIAGPVLYETASNLVELWRSKSRLANGRPFDAHHDIYHFALDAMSGFTFGHDFDVSSVRPTSSAIENMGKKAQEALTDCIGKEEPVSFPHGKMPDLMWAFQELTELVAYLLGNPLPHLTWAWILRKPASKKAYRIKEQFIKKELDKAVKRLEDGVEKPESAVDYIVTREKTMAERAGRKPNYLSRVIIDEIFGIVYTGHETTATMLSWAVKFLADNPRAQDELRAALHGEFVEARAAGRAPTVQEITGRQVPWLEATIEESLRCSATAPSVDRTALADTQILGYRIPKGTVVAQPCSGPSITTPAFDNIDEAVRSPSSLAARRQGGLVPPNWQREGISVWNPERWLVVGGGSEEEGDSSGNAEGKKKKQKKLEFNPNAGPQVAFGLGTRGCYGKRLTYVESRILLTLLVWRFELLPCAPKISRYTAVMTTANAPRDYFVRLRELDEM